MWGPMKISLATIQILLKKLANNSRKIKKASWSADLELEFQLLQLRQI
jgi:hypothetical protein